MSEIIQIQKLNGWWWEEINFMKYFPIWNNITDGMSSLLHNTQYTEEEWDICQPVGYCDIYTGWPLCHDIYVIVTR